MVFLFLASGEEDSLVRRLMGEEEEMQQSNQEPKPDMSKEALELLEKVEKEWKQRKEEFKAKGATKEELKQLLESIERELNALKEGKETREEVEKNIEALFSEMMFRLEDRSIAAKAQQLQQTGKQEPSLEKAFEGIEEPQPVPETPSAAQPEIPEQQVVVEPKLSMPTRLDFDKGEELFEESLKFLESLQLENGGCLATNVQEKYPYIYPRDHAFCTLAFVAGERYTNAKKALEFALKGQNVRDGSFPQRWDQLGKDASYKPVQIDATALMLYALAKYVQSTSDVGFAENNWEKLAKAVDFINSRIVASKNLVSTPSSIHEFPPLEHGYELWTNSACCAALTELSKVADIIKVRYEPLDADNIIKEGILSYLWNSRLKTFIKNIRVKESNSVVLHPDASLAAVSYFDVFPASNDRVKSTISYIESNLWHKKLGGICRVPKEHSFAVGGWGPWPFFTLLLAEHYTKLGDKERASFYLSWVVNIAYNNQLPEHVSDKEEFEHSEADFKDAGLLRKDTMTRLENAKKHPAYMQKGVAYITVPFGMPHAEFVVAWQNFKQRFGF
jgi:tetratricopeptide (TPR) repeat protein